MSKGESFDSREELEDDKKIEKLIEYIEKLGLEKLAREIAEERFARKVVESKMVADYYSINASIWEMREDRVLQEETQLVSALYDKSSSYNNVILTLGYAGFFAIWSNVKIGLTFTANLWVGSMLGVSLMAFIIWTILNMLAVMQGIKEL